MNAATRSLRAAVLVAALAAAGSSLPAAAVQITLGWDASPSPGVAGYRVFYGTSSGFYSSKVDAGNATTVAIGGLQPNQAYYLTVASYDAAGNQSALSSEVSTGAATAGGGSGGGAPGAAAPAAATGGGGCAFDPAQTPDVTLAMLFLAAVLRCAVQRRRAGRPSLG
jgi:Fibronectin type III domain